MCKHEICVVLSQTTILKHANRVFVFQLRLSFHVGETSNAYVGLRSQALFAVAPSRTVALRVKIRIDQIFVPFLECVLTYTSTRCSCKFDFPFSSSSSSSSTATERYRPCNPPSWALARNGTYMYVYTFVWSICIHARVYIHVCICVCAARWCIRVSPPRSLPSCSRTKL